MTQPFVPPSPAPLQGKVSPIRRVREAMRSSIGFLRAGRYDIQVGRHRIPRLPGRPQRFTYSLRDFSLVREVLVERAFDFPKSRLMYTILSPLTGNSIFVSNGDTWRKQRAMIDRAFEAARLRAAFPRMRDAADALVERMDGHLARGKVVSIEPEATHVAADIIFRTIFSEPIDAEEGEAVFRAFEAFQGLAYAHGILSLAGLPLWCMPGRWRSWRKARRIRRALGAMLDKRIAGRRAGQAVPDDDILANLIDCIDPDTGRPVGREDLLNQIAMLFLAGHETSAAALGWTLYLLANCPEKQERARAEVLSVLGEREAQFGDMSSLPFVRDVFREAMRLYPPVANLARDTTREEKMGRWTIDPGAVMFVQTWLLQRHPEAWPEPDAFEPERWGCPYAREAQRKAYFPFSLGPRVCSGAGFAMQEATLILAMLLRRYRFAPVPGRVPEPVARLTLRSANGIHLEVTRV